MRVMRNILILSVAIFSLSASSIIAQTTVGTSAGQATSIGQQVNRKILGLPYYGVFDIIQYEVNGGTVTLSGKVNSLGVKRDAVSVVKRIPGVTNVVDNIRELPPSSFDDSIRRQAIRTFAGNGLGRYFWPTAPDVHIIVDGGRLTLAGEVANSGDLNRLNIYARGLTGVFNVQNDLTVRTSR